jgi:uncharacterized protein
MQKPGRDPRPAFTSATFAAGVEKIADLKPGMVLEGVVTNVAAFGAFVDVGVHQDGLVHISAMAEHYVSDPHQIVRSGQVVRVKVVDVDVERQRIGLSLRLHDQPERKEQAERAKRPAREPATRAGLAGREHGRQQSVARTKNAGRADSNPVGNSMAQALRDAGFG